MPRRPAWAQLTPGPRPCAPAADAGFIFMAVTLLGVRSKLVELIPRSIML